MSIKERLKSVIYKVMDSDNRLINDNTNLIDDLNFDSLSMVSLIVEIESEFNIVLDDEDLELELLSNMNTLTHLISEKLGRE